MLEALPQRIQAAARLAFERFRESPDYPSLERHPLHDDGRGRHKRGSFAVCAGSKRYRAIYVPDTNPTPPHKPANVWYWIGTHEDYNNFVGK